MIKQYYVVSYKLADNNVKGSKPNRMLTEDFARRRKNRVTSAKPVIVSRTIESKPYLDFDEAWNHAMKNHTCFNIMKVMRDE